MLMQRQMQRQPDKDQPDQPMQDYSSSFLQRIKDLIEIAKERDFAYLRQVLKPDIIQQLYFVIKHWIIFEPSFHQSLVSLLGILNSKFQSGQKDKTKRQLKLLLFPFLERIIGKMKTVIKMKGQQNKKGQQDNVVKRIGYVNKEDDQIAVRFQQLSLRAHKDGANWMQGEVSSELTISRKMLYSILQALFQLNTQQINQHQDLPISMQKIPVDYISQIQYQKFSSFSCLGCSQFFYSGLNIFDSQMSQTPVIVMQGIARIQELQVSLKNEICSLLNGHGGIILFDCKSIDGMIIPIGEYFNNMQQAQTEQRIYDYLVSIYPLPKVLIHVQVSYVPIIENPEENASKPHLKKRIFNTYDQHYLQRQFTQGLFVTRIKVNPIQGQKLYFWINEQKIVFPLKLAENNQMKMIKPRRMHKYIKKRFKRYYVPQNQDMESKFNQQRPSCFHRGECTKPDPGKTTSFIKKSRQSQFSNKKKSFQYISILIAKKTHLPAIRQNLQKLNVEFQMEHQFERLKLKAEILSTIFHHNMRFDDLLRVIQLPYFIFNNKSSHVILVTSFLKLINRTIHKKLHATDYTLLCDWLSHSFPQEQLNIWAYTNQKQVTEIYVQTQTKYSMILMYYVLNSFSETAYFRNPQNLDKVSNIDLQYRFELIYPENQHQQGIPQRNLPLNIPIWQQRKPKVRVPGFSSQKDLLIEENYYSDGPLTYQQQVYEHEQMLSHYNRQYYGSMLQQCNQQITEKSILHIQR